ncbi:MAG: Rab family GTPase [Candidatus Hodarchaeales archaeon]
MKLTQGKYSKVVVIGDGAVGKTSLIEHILGREFHSSYLLTIGANISTYPYTSSSGNLFRFQFWDLAGQTRFDFVRVSFYRGCQAAILVFDVTRPISLKNLMTWQSELFENARAKVPYVVVGNKSDLEPSYEEDDLKNILNIKEHDLDFEIPYVKTSARMGTNVFETLEILSQMILKYRMKRKQVSFF